MCVVRNMVGRPKAEHAHKFPVPSNFVGDDIEDKKEMLSMSYPMKEGIIVNWDDMERIWDYIFMRGIANTLEINF